MQEAIKSLDYDIVIVGAGLVGTSVVVALQNAGLRIAVLEKDLSSVTQPKQEDSRPLTLAYGSQRYLQKWGVWEAPSSVAMPIRALHVSEKGRLGRVRFTAEEENVSALGYVVPFAQLQKTLYQKAAAISGVDFIEIDSVNSLVCNSDGAQVVYSAYQVNFTINASLLLVADGAQSDCRRLLGIHLDEKQTEDCAFIATVQCQDMHEGTAYQRFTPQGSMALLPLMDRYQYRLVWTLKKAQHQIVEQWSDEELLAALSDAYGGRLGELQSVQREAVFPLSTIIAKEMVRDSVVLLGNAAHTIYPVAAQGFNLSLQDLAALTRVLLQALQHGEPIHTLSTLQRYLDRRQKNQEAVIQWSERIADVFHWHIPCLDHARGVALLSLDTMPFLKHNFSRIFLHA